MDRGEKNCIVDWLMVLEGWKESWGRNGAEQGAGDVSLNPYFWEGLVTSSVLGTKERWDLILVPEECLSEQSGTVEDRFGKDEQF